MTKHDRASPDPLAPDPRLPELFAQARDRAGEEREAFLAALRSENPVLASSVEELLSAESAGEARFADAVWRFPDEATALPPKIGPYRPLREIGRASCRERVFVGV